MILLLIHIEEGTDWFDDAYLERVCEFIETRKPDRVVHMTSGIVDGVPHYSIRNLVDTEIEWGWGYDELDDDEPKERPFVIPSYGHEYTWVPPSFRQGGDLWRLCRGNDVVIGGGIDGECLEDFRAILRWGFLNFRDERTIIF